MTTISPQNQSPLDNEPYLSEITRLIVEDGDTNSSIVEFLKERYPKLVTTRHAISRFRRRHQLNAPSFDRGGCTIKGNEATVTTKATEGYVLTDPDTMLEERGLDPKEWQIDTATVNEWEGFDGETKHQAKLHLKKRIETQIFAARDDGWKAPPRQKRDQGKSRLIVVTGDQQAPYQDEQLHYLFCGWLEENKPDVGVALGDKVDFPDISRHRLDPENTAKVNECIQVGYNIFRDYRTSSLDTEWLFMPGNHDERIRNILLDKPSVQPLYGVRRAHTETEEGEPVLTLPHLLRLDELGIDYIDPEGPYDLAQVNLSSKLAVRHGWIARQGSGTSGLATLEHLGYSIIVGHTHRQSLTYKTTHDIDGNPTILTAAEAGCMCRIDQQNRGGRKFPDFSVLPDWQQGFTTVVLHDDGTFRIDNATFVHHGRKSTLLWRNQRYKL